MSASIHQTKGIVIRTVKYGETSLILTVYTERFGLQSYLVNGVRTQSRKGSNEAGYFQPGALLDLMVYHNEFKNLHRIREYKWAHLYQHLFFDVLRNCIALFMIELLQKTIREPEPNADLFNFIEDALLHLDQSSHAVAANYPLFFASQLTNFFGFRISDQFAANRTILDLQEGGFVSERPHHPHWLEEPYSELAAMLLRVMHPSELVEIRMNQEKRKILLQAYLRFYQLHVQDFGTMKTVSVLQEVLR